MNPHLNANHRLGDPLPRHIALVRSLPGLGDFLCIVPTLRAIRTALPKTQITWIGLPQTQYLMQRFSHYLDEWLEFPGYPGIPEMPLSPTRVVRFLAQAQALNFDLALQLHGSGSHINGFTLLLGARQTAGFYPPEQACPDGDRFLPYPPQESEVLRYLRLLNFLGIPSQGEHLEFPLHSSDWQDFEAIARAHTLHHTPYICIHPGASTPARRWSHGNFAIVADALAAQGFRIVLTGTATDAPLTRSVAEAMRYPALDLAGKTPQVGALAALLHHSSLLICNDTGVSHLAAALGVRSVVIFCDSDPTRWAPLDSSRHRAICGFTPLTTTGRKRLDEGVLSTPLLMHPSPAPVLVEALDLLQREMAHVS